MNNKLETWSFGVDNDRLVDLVLQGRKTATTSIYNENSVSEIGEESILVYNNEKKACIVKTKKVIITEFKNITEELAELEGEGSFDEWRTAHIEFFKAINSDFNENTKVEFEIFEVTKNLVKQRLELAKSIVQANLSLFGDIKNINEINAGFNNSIFNVNDKYIIKVCGEKEKENLFDVEADFYRKNQENKNIPMLYRYDKSKRIVPFVYEIIEKINGKSVYYYWYKMSEAQREKFIKDLVQILKNIHFKEYDGYDWSAFVKNKILSDFHKTITIFNEEEKKIILESIEQYDKILSNNRFCLIHNDLHFDNILIEKEENIKLIDFNDSIIAPFDFDLRLLYMSVTLPWKWANIEMDSYQKEKDYKYLFEYVKKYYTELNEVKYLNERMVIYSVLNDFELLSRFWSRELKERILSNLRKIINII